MQVLSRRFHRLLTPSRTTILPKFSITLHFLPFFLANTRYSATSEQPKRKRVLAHDLDVIRPAPTQSQHSVQSKRERDMMAVRKLIASKWDPNSTNMVGETKLHTAAEDGHIEMVKELLRAKADVNCKSRYRCTPLHYAGWNGDVGMVRLLLRLGGDVYVTNFQGETAVDYCLASRKGKHADTLSCLTSAIQRKQQQLVLSRPDTLPGSVANKTGASTMKSPTKTKPGKPADKFKPTTRYKSASTLKKNKPINAREARSSGKSSPPNSSASRMSMRGESSRAPAANTEQRFYV